jgi:hypothetical protein
VIDKKEELHWRGREERGREGEKERRRFVSMRSRRCGEQCGINIYV